MYVQDILDKRERSPWRRTGKLKGGERGEGRPTELVEAADAQASIFSLLIHFTKPLFSTFCHCFPFDSFFYLYCLCLSCSISFTVSVLSLRRWTDHDFPLVNFSMFVKTSFTLLTGQNPSNLHFMLLFKF